MRKLLLIVTLITSNLLFSQEAEDQPFAVIEVVPTYPGCSGDNQSLKECMSSKISALVGQNFNVKKTSKGVPAGKHRIFVSFRINKKGKIDNIKTRSEYPKFEKEAKRVIGLIPKMKPGYQKGKAVGVLYSLPITFQIDEDKKSKKL